MVTDQQYRRLMKLSKTEKTKAKAAAKAGMDEKTARKYVRIGAAPSQVKQPREYLTRADTFSEDWPEIERLLKEDASLEAVTIFDYLCRENPEKFQESQIRTLQRRLKVWRAQYGARQEVFFPQEHVPGRQGQSDFTYMNELGITIAGQRFDHLFYHFTLTSSNWEWGNVCFSESYESLSQGVEKALWELGGVPIEHRTDSLSAAVTVLGNRDEFTARYQGLLNHYGMKASHTSPGRGNENGDIEQSHHRFKRSVGQELILRGGRDFCSRLEYVEFLERLLRRRNKMRSKGLNEELGFLRVLPARRLEEYTRETARVTRNSTVQVRNNFYSVPSQLIRERVEVRVYVEHLEIWYSGKLIQKMPRLIGRSCHAVDYRHVIHSLVRKPGAFAQYKYRESLFPRLIFRVAYDWLREQYRATADRQYLKLLEMAAHGSEDMVAEALRGLVERGETLTPERVGTWISSVRVIGERERLRDIAIEKIELGSYDTLLLTNRTAATEEVAA